MTGSQITIDRAQEIFKDIVKYETVDAPLTIEQIQKIVAKNFNLDIKDIKGKKRTDTIAHPRQIAMYIARKFTEFSTIEIGASFGGRDHTTVLYSFDKIEKAIIKDAQFSAQINKIVQEIKSGR